MLTIKKLIWRIMFCVVFIILLFNQKAFADPGNPLININKIIHIESHGNPLAFNTGSGAHGLCQITPICLKEYNNFHANHYSLKDLFNPTINKEIASWYLNIRIPQLLKHYNKPINTNNILISYNAGINYVVKNKPLKKETRDYIKKYNR